MQTASAIAILVCISLVIIGYVFYALLVEYSSINSRCGIHHFFNVQALIVLICKYVYI